MKDGHKLQALARRGERLRNELDTLRGKVMAFKIPVKAGPRSQGRLESSLTQLEAEVHAIVAELEALGADLREWQQSRTTH
jgi:chromosome segregation ATPase